MSEESIMARNSRKGDKSKGISTCSVVLGFIVFLMVFVLCFYGVSFVAPPAKSGSSGVGTISNANVQSVTGPTTPQLRSNSDLPEIVEQNSSNNMKKECNKVVINVSTTKGDGDVILEIHHDWAPLGAARFCELVEAKYYDDVRFFRVLKVSN